jgi:fumarylacetoacetase
MERIKVPVLSWLEIPAESDFPLYNIPFGIFSASGISPRVCTRIGDMVIDLSQLADSKYFKQTGVDSQVFHQATLNAFIGSGKVVCRAVRARIMELFSNDCAELRDIPGNNSSLLYPVSEVTMHMPVRVGDYTDFYSSIEHATNVGMMFRDPANALLPNWRHLPVGYHGRSSSIVVSGTPIHRPKGQTKSDQAELPEFGPTRQLDFELEMAFITGASTSLGSSLTTAEAEDYIFGLVLFNDLSARDIQKWEYVPLGPFLAKNFGSAISPWVVTLDALEPFRVEGPKQEPEVLPYLQFTGARNFDIHLDVLIGTEGIEPKRVCRSNFRYMYWNMAQQLAHHTVNGCNLNIGDMYGSGTISGPTPDSYGSMLELTWKGTKPIGMPDGSERRFIHDLDTIIMRGYCQKEHLRLGFGEVSTKILPAM